MGVRMGRGEVVCVFHVEIMIILTRVTVVVEGENTTDV